MTPPCVVTPLLRSETSLHVKVPNHRILVLGYGRFMSGSVEIGCVLHPHGESVSRLVHTINNTKLL